MARQDRLNLAQLLAVRSPGRVARLGLVCSFGYGDWPARELRLARAMPPVTRNLPTGWLVGLLGRDMQRGYAEPERAARSTELYLRPFSGEEGRDALLAHMLQLDSADTVTLASHLGEIAETWPDDRWWLAIDAPARGVPCSSQARRWPGPTWRAPATSARGCCCAPSRPR